MQRELEKACDNNDMKKINYIINLKDFYNFNLNFLCKQGNLELVKYIVKKGIKLNNEELQYACISGNLELVKFIIQEGYNNYKTAIHGACISNNINIIKYLVDELKVPIASYNIISACNIDNLEIVNYLIDKAPHLYNELINNKNHENYELVLSKGHIKKKNVKHTIKEDLINACIQGNLNEIKVIIEEKGIQQKNLSNLCLNWYLSSFGNYKDVVNYDIINYLIDLAKKNNEDIEPPNLDYICWSGDLKLVKYFIENYSYNTFRLNYTITSLNRNDKYNDIIKYLYENGANDYNLLIEVVDEDLQQLLMKKTNICNNNIIDYLKFTKEISC